MASKLSEAADNVLSWAEKHQAVIDVGKELKRIGSIEQASEEATKARDLAQSKLDATNKALAQAADELNSVKTEAATRLAGADTEAKAIIEKARKDADAILRAGNVDAKNLRDVAAKDAAATAAQAQAALDDMTGKVSDARDELAGHKAAAAETKKAHDDLKAKVADLKKTAQSILA